MDINGRIFSEPRSGVSRRRAGRQRCRERSNSEGNSSTLSREIFTSLDDGRWAQREEILRKALSPTADYAARASVFVTVRSSTVVAAGMLLALVTIGSTIACSLIFASDLQGLIYPYISETARDMPQTGFFGFGMTITSMFMVLCAVLQYGKVKRDIRTPNEPYPRGSKRNLVAVISGMIAPPFLGLLACYDTKRALLTHRVCVIIFFTLTTAYMFTTLSIYSYLASDDFLKKNTPKRANVDNVKYSLKLKTNIATSFVLLSTFYLPIGTYLCRDPFGAEYTQEDVYLHAARAMCQHLAVVMIILYYGTFYYDFGNLNLYMIKGQ